MAKKYGIRYKIDAGKFTKKELLAGDFGGCDQIMICSYAEGNDGSGSYLWMAKDGENGDMRPERQLHCAMMLMLQLSKNPLASKMIQEFSGVIWETFREAICRREAECLSRN